MVFRLFFIFLGKGVKCDREQRNHNMKAPIIPLARYWAMGEAL